MINAINCVSINQLKTKGKTFLENCKISWATAVIPKVDDIALLGVVGTHIYIGGGGLTALLIAMERLCINCGCEIN
ncbi:hypothetical protein T12_3934 [Trichinella patagoniensis]|uniref:Uncharacterized protein n=1 Tax=Trichinella patagoniensis TaxID=990121 RepID=A0A0V0ZXQ0_9BILA|nr:hypothetical protein T12_3934 [Trichinella patagoniensis]